MQIYSIVMYISFPHAAHSCLAGRGFLRDVTLCFFIWWTRYVEVSVRDCLIQGHHNDISLRCTSTSCLLGIDPLLLCELVELGECEFVRKTESQLGVLQHVVEVQILDLVLGCVDLSRKISGDLQKTKCDHVPSYHYPRTSFQ